MTKPKQPTKAQFQRVAVTEAVLAAGAGFIPAGTTDTETVRIPTQASPVYGATGGELRTIGGRARYTKPGTTVRAELWRQGKRSFPQRMGYRQARRYGREVLGFVP